MGNSPCPEFCLPLASLRTDPSDFGFRASFGLRISGFGLGHSDLSTGVVSLFVGDDFALVRGPGLAQGGACSGMKNGHQPVEGQAQVRRKDLFPDTHWSLVLTAGAGSGTRAVEALGRLCANYREPIYRWLRAAGCSHHEADDTTQQLIEHLLSRQHLAPLSPQGGRFRTYLLACLRNLLHDQRDRQHAAKRGGGVEHCDISTVEVPWDAATCGEELDRAFALATHERAVATLAVGWKAKGHSDRFQALRRFLLAAPEEGAYATVGHGLGLSPAQVKRAVFDLREDYYDAFRAQVAQTVAPEELAEELKYLITLAAAMPEPAAPAHESPA